VVKTKLKKLFNKITGFAKNNPLEFWILIVILTVGAFCRLYKISGYMTFLGDEGRDVIIVRRLLVEGHPPLIGPGTSIGNMYLGPFYYYMMAPALFLAAYSPVGPAVQIAILGIITIWFVWYAGSEWFGSITALVAAGLYAISPTVIIYSHSSWNPNIMPFFALLSIYSIWKVWKDHKYNWLLMLGFSFAAVVQSHYLGLLLVPTLFIFWALTIWDLKRFEKWKSEGRKFISRSLWGIVIFLDLMSPLLIFDIRHNWVNARAMYQFFTVRQTTVSIRPWTAIPKIPDMLKMINTSLLGGKNVLAGDITAGIFGFGLLALLIYAFRLGKKNISKLNPAYYLLISWLGFGLIGFGIYKQNIYDHYFGFLFMVPFLITGIIVSFLSRYKLIGKLIGSVLVIYLAVVSLLANPFRYPPNNELQRAIDVSKKIEQVDGNQRFNLGVIAVQNYEDGYKYFLLKDGAPVVDIDSQVKDSITNQLFVVCELEKSKCDPTHNPVAAVANFGWSKIDSSWDVDGVVVYKLVHSKP
jgi:4-amino-4-deoxy-L-arabinose transferase-like glycosyltransferase